MSYSLIPFSVSGIEMSYSLIPFSVSGLTASVTVCSTLYWLCLLHALLVVSLALCATCVFVACVLLLRVWCVGLMCVWARARTS